MLDHDVHRSCDQDQARSTPPKPSNSVRLGSVWGSKQVRLRLINEHRSRRLAWQSTR